MAHSGWPRTEEKLSLGRWIELEPLWLGVVRRRPVLCAHTALAGSHVCDPVGGSQAEVGSLVSFGLACSLLPDEKAASSA